MYIIEIWQMWNRRHARQTKFLTVVFPRCFPRGSLQWFPIQVLSKPWIGPWNQIRYEIAKHADTPATACLCTLHPWTPNRSMHSNWTDCKLERKKAGAELNIVHNEMTCMAIRTYRKPEPNKKALFALQAVTWHSDTDRTKTLNVLHSCAFPQRKKPP